MFGKIYRKCTKKNYFQVVYKVKKKDIESFTQNQCGDKKKERKKLKKKENFLMQVKINNTNLHMQMDTASKVTSSQKFLGTTRKAKIMKNLCFNNLIVQLYKC